TSAKSARTLSLKVRPRTESFSFLPLREAVSIIPHLDERETAGRRGGPGRIAFAVANCARDRLLVDFAASRAQQRAGDRPHHVTEKPVGGHCYPNQMTTPARIPIVVDPHGQDGANARFSVRRGRG